EFESPENCVDPASVKYVSTAPCVHERLDTVGFIPTREKQVALCCDQARRECVNSLIVRVVAILEKHSGVRGNRAKCPIKMFQQICDIGGMALTSCGPVV